MVLTSTSDWSTTPIVTYRYVDGTEDTAQLEFGCGEVNNARGRPHFIKLRLNVETMTSASHQSILVLSMMSDYNEILNITADEHCNVRLDG
jgi:hypothetical protein